MVLFFHPFPGLFKQSNIICLYAAIGVLAGSFCLKYISNNVQAVLLFGFTLACLSAIILIASGNRGSWVGLVAALLVFVAFEARRNPGIMAAFLAVIAIFCFAIFSNLSLPMSRLNLLIEGYPSLREEVWQSVLALFWENPMFGYGLETRGILAKHHHIYF